MSEETKNPQAEEPAVEPNTAEQAARKLHLSRQRLPRRTLKRQTPRKGWLLQQEGPGAGGCEGKAGRG